MHMLRRWTSRRAILITLFILLVGLVVYYHTITRSYGPYVPNTRIRPMSKSSFPKVSVVHYTEMYSKRIDSLTEIFDSNLKQICEILDPEEYSYADAIIVTLLDFVRFPLLSDRKDSYRMKHPSQLWLFHTEESPRNSYRSMQMKSVAELDEWFNLTATLKPDSDLHIQYKGYRVKPAIVNLITDKLNLTFNHTSNTSVLSPKHLLSNNNNSVHLNTLARVLNHELQTRQDSYLKACPHSCNQPLSAEFINALQPYLKPIVPHVDNRDTVYIAWFVSNCDSHSGREEYVLQLRSQPGIRVDIYGKCASMLHSHVVPIQCEKGTPNCIEETLAHYRFYLAFENSKCDTYITEKYWVQGLNGRSIPIVLGAKRQHYQRIAVPNSYIHVDDYPTVEHLAQELHRLNRNDSEYVRYLQWTQLYDVDGSYGPTTRYDMYSTLCLLSHYQRLHAMKSDDEQRSDLLERIRNIFGLERVHLPNFSWETATTRSIRISEFYNPQIDCWDNDFPRLYRRVYNFLFLWWKLL